MAEEKQQEKAEGAKNLNSDWKSRPGSFRVLSALLAILLVVVIFAAGMHAAHREDRPGFVVHRGFGMQQRLGDARPGFMDNAQAQNRLVGVVTAVNGSSLTVAGNGATSTVNTSSSTRYRNGNATKVNDTVMILGTNNNGTWTAEQIVINP
jgi:hypothetical protein